MKNYKWTIIGLVLSAITYLVIMILDIDLFEILVGVFERFEEYEIDEVLIPCVILCIFLIVDLFRRQRIYEIEFKKIEIYKSMMSSTHHILNNLLNQMQLFKMTVEDIPGFDPTVLALYDQIIKEASAKIDALGSITNINETSIRTLVAPLPNTRASTQPVAQADRKG